MPRPSDDPMSNPARLELLQHPFLRLMQEGMLSKAQMEIVLANWWVILSYFPDFLAKTLLTFSHFDLDFAIRSRLAHILSQELGADGNPKLAHGHIFIKTVCETAEFPRSIFNSIVPLPGTVTLLNWYRDATDNAEAFAGNPRSVAAIRLLGGPQIGPFIDYSLDAFGLVLATELVDEALVRGIGLGIQGATGVPLDTLEWVTIHQTKESDHRHSTLTPFKSCFRLPQERRIQEIAELSWTRWGEFFSSLAVQLT